jgi:hypothetical protein
LKIKVSAASMVASHDLPIAVQIPLISLVVV